MIKSHDEIDLLKKSAEVSDTFRACFENGRPGMTERQVARIAAKEMIERGAERPGFRAKVRTAALTITEENGETAKQEFL